MACGSAELLLVLGDDVPALCSSWGSSGSVVHAVAGMSSAVTAPTARLTVCPVGLEDRSCMCQVVVGAGGMLVGWPAAPGEEIPAPDPAWGLPCIAASPGIAAGLGGPSCSPRLPAGSSPFAVACGTRMPVERDKAAPAGSTPPRPQQAGTCPRPAACRPYLSSGCPRRRWSGRRERGALPVRLRLWGAPGTCPGLKAARRWCCRPHGRCCPTLMGPARGQVAAPSSPRLVQKVGEGRMRKRTAGSPHHPHPTSLLPQDQQQEQDRHLLPG